jgi:hypothetical protein
VLLQDTQQFGLQRGSEFTHFIQKDRSTVGQLQLFLGDRAGKGSSL